jgi:L-ascorbate metabolism protein UlaG (beta-lactamase superfamily)
MTILLKGMLAAVIVVISLFLISSFVIGFILSAPGYQGKKTDHFTGNKFQNPGNIEPKGFKDLIKWTLNRNPGKWEDITSTGDNHIPSERVDSLIRIYYVNHSTFLIQTSGLNILTDPIWSERASPFQWAGPIRKRPPGISFDNLPEIDIVLISHNHYDHLDMSTIQKLNNSFQPEFICPLGVSVYLNKNGISRTREMDWWDKYSLSESLSIACVQAQHFSGRGFFDRDKTLWAGYVIQSEFGNIYFAGDTGYGNFFKKIASDYGPIHLALLPIGAYLPRWFMAPIHTSPEDAVKIHMDLNAKKSIGMHYGTFPLADDGMKEPLKDLKKAKSKYSIKDFVTLEEGQYIDLN